MMNTVRQLGAALLLLALSMQAGAQVIDKAERIKQRLLSSRPDLPITSVTATEAPGLYAVELSVGEVLYATEGGEYFVLGSLFQVKPDGLVNLTEEALNVTRKELLAGVEAKDTIVFPSTSGETKSVLHVFTDIDCGYCRKLHKEIKQINALGIEVRYLAYPRAGLGSPSYGKLVTAWCAKDRNLALTELKNGDTVSSETCDNPVAAQYQLGGSMGVTGTPALVTSDGRLIPGYMPAQRLARELGVK